MGNVQEAVMAASSGNRAANECWQFPARPGYQRFAVPEDIRGAEILFLGSDSARADTHEPELIIDYRAKNGAERRIVLAFTELGMWLKSNRDHHPANSDKESILMRCKVRREVFPVNVEPCGCAGAVMPDGQKRMTAVCEIHVREHRFSPEDLLPPEPEIMTPEQWELWARQNS